MSLGERLLLACCRDPKAPDYPGGTVRANVANALDFLDKTVPNFRHLVSGRVLDFGCGWGHQAIAMAIAGGATEVVGIDIQWHERARQLAEEYGCSDRVRFVQQLAPSDCGIVRYGSIVLQHGALLRSGRYGRTDERRR